MALRLSLSVLKGKARATSLETLSSGIPARRFISSTATGIGSSTSASSSSSAAATEGVTPPIESTSSALALLRSQPHHYIVASIAGRTLLMHPNDLVTLPRLNEVQVGDVLELDRIHEVGSRDYTLRATDPLNTRSRGAAHLMRRQVGNLDSAVARAASNPETTSSTPPPTPALVMSTSWAARLAPAGLAHVGATLEPTTVRARAVVVEHTKGPMEHIVKFKRRKGYKKTITHKQTYTRLRIEEIQLGSGSA